MLYECPLLLRRLTGDSVRLLRLVFGGVLLAFAGACSISESPVAPEQDLPELPKFEIFSSCEMFPDDCAIIQAGITYLKEHANAICRVAGYAAQGRYDAESGEGFRYKPQYGDMDMSVYTVGPGSWVPADEYTNVYPRFWNSGNTNPQSTGGLIAHEEALNRPGFTGDSTV